MSRCYTSTSACLIPAFNDDYSLFLCLESVAPYFDEIWINDDGSFDNTDKVIQWALMKFKNVRANKMSTQVGWVNSIEWLFSNTNARHIFRIDADDVLYPSAARDIKRIMQDKYSCVLFGLQESWGDFHHSRRGLEIYHDPTHLYIDREKCEIIWLRGPAPTFWPVAQTSARKQYWPKATFFHMPGVKSDERCVLRTMISKWEADGKPCSLFEWPRYNQVSSNAVHYEALRWLLFHNGKHRKLTHIPDIFIPKIWQYS